MKKELSGDIIVLVISLGRITMARLKKKRDFTDGPIFTSLLAFVIPIILTGMLQTLYGMADNIVVGRFSGDPDALKAVGSTLPLSNLTVSIMTGLSAGAGVVIAQLYGAKRDEELSSAVHTSMLFAVIFGISFMALGVLLARPVLTLMGTKAGFFSKSLLYITIVFLGLPGLAVYNFGAAVLRSIGDSKSSLYILTVSGLINVALNLLFVVVFNMSVAGVATATIVSQYFSAVATLTILMKRKGNAYTLNLRRLKIDRRMLMRSLRLGLPMALQGCLFSGANIIIASSVNTFDDYIVAAKTIAFNMEEFTGTAMMAFSQATMAYVGQNWGARKYGRINKALIYSIIQVTVIGLVLSFTEILFGREIALMYMANDDPMREEIIAAVFEIFWVMLSTYFLCGIMQAISGVLKGLGYSFISMLAAVAGIVVRVSLVLILVPIERFHTVFWLFIAYPISWVATVIMLAVFCVYVWRKLGISKGAKEKINAN